MAVDTSKSAQLLSHLKELSKSYITYDATNRAEYVYTSKADATTGDAAIVTRYVYDGTSTRITKRLESNTVWDATYDIS